MTFAMPSVRTACMRSSSPGRRSRCRATRTSAGTAAACHLDWESLLDNGVDRSWLYRILPPVVHEKFERASFPHVKADFARETLTPQQLRWSPTPFPGDAERVDFIDGLRTIGNYQACCGGAMGRQLTRECVP